MRGAMRRLLMGACVRLEERSRADDGARAAIAALATFVALAAAAILNRDTPLWDYETWAAETSSSKSTSFTWNHSYTSLDSPRDGRDLRRVGPRQPAYWKAENLDLFDGER